MSTDTLLNDLDAVIDEGKALPLTNKILVDAEEMKRIIEDLRLNMPDEIEKAKKIAAERSDILKDARAEAEDIIAKARARADLMIEEHQITKEAKDFARDITQQANSESASIIANAKARASEIESDAEKWASDLQRNATTYVENAIRDTDEILTSSVNSITKDVKAIRELRASFNAAVNRSRNDRPHYDD